MGRVSQAKKNFPDYLLEDILTSDMYNVLKANSCVCVYGGTY